jgi:polar amino acid transport system substrate-binding protein
MCRMNMVRRFLALTGLLGPWLMTGAQAQPQVLQAFTEEWAPYNYTEGDKLRGIATDTLRALCAETGLRCVMESVPWARAYRSAQMHPNVMVFTTARVAEREQEFLWVGPLLPRVTWVYGRRGAKRLHDAQQLAQLRYAVVRGEAAAKDLQAAGVPASALLEQSNNTSALRSLLAGHAEALVDTEVGMAWNMRQLGADMSEVQPLWRLSDRGAYYFALNKQSDPGLAEKLQAALDKLRRQGTLDEIRRSYLHAPTGEAR